MLEKLTNCKFLTNPGINNFGDQSGPSQGLKIRGGALCVEMGFTWTFPRNQDAKVKLNHFYQILVVF